jgi:hypothetical protein
MKPTRRGFLAAAGAVIEADAPAVPAADDKKDGHDHRGTVRSALRVKALESLLFEKGLVDRVTLDALVDTYEHKVGPRNGARVVAKAWTDPELRNACLKAERPRSLNSVTPASRVPIFAWWRIRPRSTT